MQRALDSIGGYVRLALVSSIYETAPMYVEDQPTFYNAAAIGESDLGPLALLNRLKQTELEVGREVRNRFGPREIDLDLIAYGMLSLTSRGSRRLDVPHPRTGERRFVLAPIVEIAPDLTLPGLGHVVELLSATNAQARDVKRINDAVLSVQRNRHAR